jgi:hypothetical protein
MISANIWHDQQLEKKFKASLILTGDEERNMEKPVITPIPAIPPITNGATAPAVRGKKDKNTIQYFFKRFIVI